MSTKPTEIANWTGTPVSPSAGKRTAGFVPDERPPAQYFDYLFNVAGQWQQYLSDGALSGAHTFNNTVGITGLLTASGGITVPTGQAVTLQGTTTLAAGGLITASAGVTSGADQHVTVSGTGDFKHGNKTVGFSAAGVLVAQSGSITVNLIADVVSGGSVVLVGTLPLKVGDRIKSVSAVFDGVASQNLTDFHISLIASNGTETSLGSTSQSGITGPVTKTVTCTPTVLAANQSFLIAVSINASGVSTRGINVTYDRP